MKILILATLFLSISTSRAEKSLGNGSAGGEDLIGIKSSIVLEQVFRSIKRIEEKLYSAIELQTIKDIESELSLTMVDSVLPTNTKNAIQNGAAFSLREGNKSTIFIKRDIWNNISTLLEREVLIHHEIMVLAGIEETGDYTYSLEYEKLRKNYWRIAEHKNTFCTINIFKKIQLHGLTIPGDLIGSSSSLMPFIGMKGDWGILNSDSKKALIWKGAIYSNGFFQMEIGEVGFYKKKSKLKLSDSVDFGTFNVIEKMRKYVNPYEFLYPVQNPLIFTDKHAIAVNCNKLDID